MLHFKFNSLSIERLCEQLTCMVQFTENICIIQTPSLKRLLVIGKDQLWLYVLDKRMVQVVMLEDRFDENAAKSTRRTVRKPHDTVVNNCNVTTPTLTGSGPLLL